MNNFESNYTTSEVPQEEQLLIELEENTAQKIQELRQDFKLPSSKSEFEANFSPKEISSKVLTILKQTISKGLLPALLASIVSGADVLTIQKQPHVEAQVSTKDLVDSAEGIVVPIPEDVQAFKFNLYLKEVLELEGNYCTDIAQDRGGLTCYGVPDYVYQEWQQGHGIAEKDCKSVRNITPPEIHDLYYERYFQEFKDFPQGVDFYLFQLATNRGRGGAKRLLREFFKEQLKLSGDDEADAADLSKISFEEMPKLFQSDPELLNQFKKYVDEQYRNIVIKHPDQRIFLEGWLNRSTNSKKLVSNYIDIDFIKLFREESLKKKNFITNKKAP